jgi:hypothetical protein
MGPQHDVNENDFDAFGQALARTPPPDDRLAGLRLALERCQADVLRARADEDRRQMRATDALLAGLELGNKNAGHWQGVSVFELLKRLFRGGR